MPGYGVHIPSVHDGLVLTCRLHYSNRLGDFANTEWAKQQGYRGAIVAHPYAPLGGSQEDHVVTETTKTLVEAGYIVMTFNFRGAGDSQGRASWTGKGEMDDYTSVFGFLVHYLDTLTVPDDPDALSRVISARDSRFDESEPFAPQTRRKHPIHVLLCGYSFGGLIMARLPHVGKMIERFANASADSFEAKIREQAQQLAESDQKVLDSKTIPHGYKMHSGAFESPERHRERDAKVAVGSSDMNPSGPRKSGDSRRSEEIVRNIISRVPHGRKHSGDRPRAKSEVKRPTTASSTNLSGPKVRAAYLMISPVLFPLTTFLIPPGLLFGKYHYDHDALGLLSLTCPIYVVYGSNDNFTSSRRLDEWVGKLKHNNHQVTSEKIAGAGHFWNGKQNDTLQKRIQVWLKDGLTVAS